MKFEGFQMPAEDSEELIELDEALALLWEEYGFIGRPPKAGSGAEERFKNKCSEYIQYLDQNFGHGHTSERLYSISETRRRQLHNEIAIMVFGKLRSGIELSKAKKITEFAFEYVNGYKISEKDKFGE